MIRHRPAGLGHPYRLEPDQRVPIQPVAGEPIELRASVPLGSPAPRIEVAIDGRPVAVELERLEPQAAGSAGDGHLATAAAGSARRPRDAWVGRLARLPAGASIAYRFWADSVGSERGPRATRTFECTVASWGESGGSIELGAPDRLVPGSVEWLVAAGRPVRTRFALRLEPGSHVVGFGERFDALDQVGRRLDAVVFEQYKNQGSRTYLPMPFAIVIEPSGRSWGFHVRTNRRSWYDVGATAPDRLGIEVALGGLDEGSGESAPIVDVAVYTGSPAEILAAFLGETGDPIAPPTWVFRPWLSSNEWNTEARVRSEIERSLAEGIPVGVLVIEAWSDETTFVAFRDANAGIHPDGAPHRLADFTFPADGAWPDPAGLVRWLHERDVRLVLWQIPLLKGRPVPSGQARADIETAIARGYVVRDGGGRPYRNRGFWFPNALLPDWTNPAARAWWLEKRRYLVDELGIDGFKTDGGEHAWGDDLRYAAGTRGDAGNNRYPVDYATAYHELMRSSGRAPVTFSRAGFTGSAAVSLHWAGDENSTWEAYRASITAGLTAGASGVFFWGWDLAGFSGEVPSAELYLRAAAMAAFCPIMQLHSEFNRHRLPSRDRTPWNIAARTGDDRVLPVYRALGRLRERLVSYLVEQAARSATTGRPLMRALCFDWPSDQRIWEFPYEYLLGEDLLVAPVVEPGRVVWPVYLPAGGWVDAWTAEPIAGGQVVERDVPIDIIPVYRRADVVLPGDPFTDSRPG